MNLGRNDPCHCGSGKKYKKCYLGKDGEAAPAGGAAAEEPAEYSEPALPQKRSRPVPSKTQDPGSIRWNEFEAADYQGKFDLFARTLDDPGLIDGEMAFEMLHRLFNESIDYDERDRFDALVRQLQNKQPDIYAEEAQYFISWQITNALVSGRREDVHTLACEMAALAGKAIDTYNQVESQLAYHGQLSTLVAAMRIAWPHIKSSSDIVPWGIDEHCTHSVACEILDYAERTSSPSAEDRELIQRLEYYMKIESASLAAYMNHLHGLAGRHWKMDDFEIDLSQEYHDNEGEPAAEEESSPAEDGGRQNLFLLTVEFLGHLRRVEGISYSKGELARRELLRFIHERHAGHLEYQESMLQAAQRDIHERSGRRPAPKRVFKPYTSMLVPDRERFEYFEVRLLNYLSRRQYHAAAVFEIIPAWLRFLESAGLIEADERTDAEKDLGGLAGGLCRALKNFRSDPAPGLACERWPG